jgi:hypothetical protein
VSEGTRVDLAVDTRRLYFFDLDTGLAIEGTRTERDRVTAASTSDRGDNERRPAPDE